MQLEEAGQPVLPLARVGFRVSPHSLHLLHE